MGRAFLITVVINLAYVAIELGCGFAFGSLALVADAWHNLSDVMGLLLAWFASLMAWRPVTKFKTYGYGRATILAALGNAGLLLIAVGGISWEAIRRFWEEPTPVSSVIIAVALVGFLINGISAWMFIHAQHSDLNAKGAYLHMLADAAVSLGVVAAGIAIYFTHWYWIDSLTSLVIAIVILWSTWDLLKESLDLALDAVPRNVNIDQVRAFLEGLPGVQSIHDLHVWALSTTESALTAHLVIHDSIDGDQLLSTITNTLHDQFRIEHSTVQLESAHLNSCPSKQKCGKQ